MLMGFPFTNTASPCPTLLTSSNKRVMLVLSGVIRDEGTALLLWAEQSLLDNGVIFDDFPRKFHLVLVGLKNSFDDIWSDPNTTALGRHCVLLLRGGHDHDV